MKYKPIEFNILVSSNGVIGQEEKKEQIRFIKESSKNNNLQCNKFIDTDSGYGASWETILINFCIEHSYSLTISGALSLFFVGEKIEKNFNAWKRILSGIKKFFSDINTVRYCENSAKLLILDKIFKEDNIQSLKIISTTTIQHKPSVISNVKGLEKYPNCYYIIAIEINEKWLEIYVVCSNGKIQPKQRVKFENYMDFDKNINT